LLVEAAELGDLALGILAIDLHGTSNEELLLLGGAGLPVVGFSDGNNKACTAGPAAMLSFLFRLGRVGTGEGLDGGELLHVPGLADAEAAVVVLSCLVHAHAPRRSYRDNDQARLLVRLGALGRRRRGGILAILMYAYVRDVRLGQLAVLIELGEAALDDTSLFILESLCARYARRRGMLELRGGVGGGRGLLRVGGVAIAVGRGARHVASTKWSGLSRERVYSTARRWPGKVEGRMQGHLCRGCRRRCTASGRRMGRHTASALCRSFSAVAIGRRVVSHRLYHCTCLVGSGGMRPW